MNTKDISEAKDPDLRASVVAMQRAAQLARTVAIQTDTGIVVVENGQMVHISAAALRAAAVAEESSVTEARNEQ